MSQDLSLKAWSFDFGVYLNPEKPTILIKDLYKEVITGNPKKVGSLGLR